ncbi:bifunctional phosphopantothenoylcysteine decarboxylase/phosphopantothenate--cysteine ligase CoaBC [uncultured Duncaniella sp.]|jgi:phosphopantothenoylcysteine decarboxylase/phosphopantothenate--cysteine ligase|uniref:bifunctional phosphopantothenoylcysteine decarboxylase/phosphopantothenate--cysteine ligase CoaBC n=1 Tax=uncultured Duncaniella sp. TaxID=2768039 RepID=UPI002675F7A1|nr:bifunctional phosphopantothenoylcysteine decarboxylase/phosphopantothenate--cysteine ligase CoaBC [uncultured Duncaniella sp.]
MSILSGKHIILGICGGIAAYKSVSLLRLFIKAGAEVQVVITPAGKEFITPVTLSALSHKPVVSEFFTANTGEWHSHVDLGLWADCMVIAPATASTIGKMAHGIADNMLVTTYLSAKSPVFVAPAMDLDMMKHPSTQANLELLSSYGNYIIEPETGYLASGLEGKGRMEEPEKIVEYLEAYFSSRCDMEGKKVLITAGPTHEKIDPVRFIGNYSSGKMGYALAEECANRGAEVTLVSGPVNLRAENPAIRTVNVESAREMLSACQEVFPDVDVAVMCAAVADYAPAHPQDHKIKREHQDVPTIELIKNPDIAATLGKEKKQYQILVGFALETDNEFSNATEKLQRKNLDMIVLNSMRDKGAGFGTDTNKVSIFDRSGNRIDFPLKSKKDVATDIVNEIVSRL